MSTNAAPQPPATVAPATVAPAAVDAPDACPDPTPLTPANVGHTVGDIADPELDVAPNMGGEEQMQDA